MLLDTFRTNSRNVVGKNPSMVITLLANQDLTAVPLLFCFIMYQITDRSEGYLAFYRSANPRRRDNMR